MLAIYSYVKGKQVNKARNVAIALVLIFIPGSIPIAAAIAAYKAYKEKKGEGKQ